MERKIFNLQKCLILQMYTAGLVSAPYAYAWAGGVYPLFEDGSIERPLKDSFEVGADFAESVLKFASSRWEKNESASFREFEAKFGERESLVKLFRYCFLENRFDAAFWRALLSEGEFPQEASVITREFSARELKIA